MRYINHHHRYVNYFYEYVKKMTFMSRIMTPKYLYLNIFFFQNNSQFRSYTLHTFDSSSSLNSISLLCFRTWDCCHYVQAHGNTQFFRVIDLINYYLNNWPMSNKNDTEIQVEDISNPDTSFCLNTLQNFTRISTLVVIQFKMVYFSCKFFPF